MTNEQTKQKMHPYSQVLQWVAEGKEIEGYVEGTWSKCSYNAVLSCALHGAYFGKILEPQDFRLKPERHIHQDLIDAFEDGAKIQFLDYLHHPPEWTDCVAPLWTNDVRYRIKLEPKLDIVCHGEFVYDLQDREVLELSLSIEQHCCDNFKVVFCGETGKLKSVEII